MDQSGFCNPEREGGEGAQGKYARLSGLWEPWYGVENLFRRAKVLQPPKGVERGR